VDFLKSLKRFWGAVCAELGKCWAEKMVKPFFWVESTFDFASDSDKDCCHFKPINKGTVPVTN
jgi:hypothetical protein